MKIKLTWSNFTETTQVKSVKCKLVKKLSFSTNWFPKNCNKTYHGSHHQSFNFLYIPPLHSNLLTIFQFNISWFYIITRMLLHYAEFPFTIPQIFFFFAVSYFVFIRRYLRLDIEILWERRQVKKNSFCIIPYFFVSSSIPYF